MLNTSSVLWIGSSGFCALIQHMKTALVIFSQCCNFAGTLTDLP